ncbi:MAG: AAA-like domain-containing protein [Oculatellaceae cyanobacterium bins.114]|nr:AAA-like domain-containing protein [Oculatellaceae cyanobacterium bins.114]
MAEPTQPGADPHGYSDPNVYTVGGTVQTNEQGLYLARPADAELLHLCRQSDFAYVLTPRQMGKSSLMIRTAEELLEEGRQAVIIDLTQIGTQVSIDEWYRGLLTVIADQLELSVPISDWWQSHRDLGVTQRLTQFFQDVVMTEVEAPLVIFVDEIDTTLSLDFTDDFFAAIRFLYVARATQPDLRRLSFVLIGVATPGDLIRDPKRTPFNIGQRVDLTDFTADEALPLMAGLGLAAIQNQEVLGWVLKWTGGHPYLTQRLCQAIAQVGGENWSEAEVDRLVTRTFLGAMSEQDNNLQFVRDMLTKRAPEEVGAVAILKTYRQIRQGKRPVLDEEQSLVKSHLKLAGIVRRQGRSLQIRNLIYRQVFDWDWIKTHLPETLWQRLKPAMPFIVAALLIAAMMTGLFLEAQTQRARAEGALQTAKEQTELAQMNEKTAASNALKAARNAREAERQRDRAEQALDDVKEQARIAQQALNDAKEQAENARRNAAEARRQRDEATRQRVVAEQQTEIARRQTEVATLREKAAVVLNWLPTARVVDGMVMAIQAMGEVIAQRPEVAKQVLTPVQSSLLAAVQSVKEKNLLLGHTAAILSVAFSPDGQTIASGSSDNTVRLWNLQGQPIGQPLHGHTDTVNSVAFSPDGKTVASGSSDNTVRLWNLQGQPIGQPLHGHTDTVNSVAFSPDGQTIASGSSDNTVRLWNVQGQPIAQPFQDHASGVLSIAFSPDGQTIASGSSDNTVRLWDLQGQPISQPFQGHTASVSSVAFSPDGQTIASGSWDNTVRLWNLQGQPTSQPLQRHTGLVWSVAFSPDGQTIASGSYDNTVRLWNLQGQPISQPFHGHTAQVLSVAFSPDGKTIASGSRDNTVRLWDLQGQPISQPFHGHTNAVFSVAFSPDRQTIASGSWDNTVRLWNVQGQPIGQPFYEPAAVLSVAFSPDGKTIASGSADKTVRLWNLQGQPIGQPFEGHTDTVWSVAFSPDGKTIASGSRDNTVRLWNLQGQPLGQPFLGHTAYVNSVAFSPDGQTIASSSADTTVRLWNVQGQPIGQPLRHASVIFSVVFSRDGQMIASGSGDNTVRLWDLQGQPIGQPFQGHTASVVSVAFSPDGQTIASGSWDNTVRLWTLDGTPIGQPFQGHTAEVLSVAFSPDGQRIVSGSFDQTVRLWHGSWQGWLQVGCNRLRQHPIFRHPDESFDPVVVRGAIEACERYVWQRMGN